MKEQEINDLINGFIRMGGYYGKYSMLLIDLRYVIEDHQEKTVNELLNSEMYKKTLEKQMEIEKEIGSNAEEDANLFRKLFYLPKFKKVWGDLPHNPDALKKSDTRAKKHLENYGELAVELDALRPDILTEKIEMDIQNELDITALNEEVRTYQDKLNKMKKKIIAYVSDEGMDE